MYTKIIAHRGASYLAHRENTREAFELAIGLHADMVEFDVRQTSDGVLVVFHDSTFADVPIAWQSYSELQEAAKAKDFQVPTLEEVLRLCHGRVKMDIEVKETGFERKLVSTLKGICSFDEYSVKSFRDVVPYKIKKIEPRIRTGLLLGWEENTFMGRLDEYFPIARLKKCHADFASPHYRLATREFLKRLRRHGYESYVWTVNDPKVVKRLLRNKAAAIITDQPDMALFYRNSRRRRREKQKK
jgi:glycerophosphoryl diester phosphodiesterase